MLAMGPRDLNSAPYSPVHCSSHSMTSFQSSELTELPVVENSQLFAQRAHSAGTACAQRTVRPLYVYAYTYMPPVWHLVHRWFLYRALDSHPVILHRTMQCPSSPEGPPSCCLDPPISVSPSAGGCGGQDMHDPYGIHLSPAPRPWRGTRAAGPCWRPRRSPPPVRSSDVWHSPPGLLSPIRHRMSVPGSRTRAGTIPNTAAGFCVDACAPPGLPPPPPRPPSRPDYAVGPKTDLSITTTV